MAVSDTLINTLFHGRYRILRKLGTGGMANVYLAEDQELGRRLAIKILNDRHAGDEQFIERFRREAKNAAGLSHPNIVSIYDRGEAEGTYYIAMEYLDGRSLKELIISRGPAPLNVAIEYARQILSALRFAHRHGIVHRDIKPHNVLVDAEGRVKVTDFGIARAGTSQMTAAGTEELATQIMRAPTGPMSATAATMVVPARRGTHAPVPPLPPVYYDLEEPIHRRPVWPWIAAFLFVVGAAVGGWFLYDQISNKLASNQVVPVELYLNMRETQARAKITADGFSPVVNHHSRRKTRAGCVF